MKLGHADEVTILESDTRRRRHQPDRAARRLALRPRRPPLLHEGEGVDELWDEILAPETMLDRPRQSRMLYRGKLYDYPLVPMNVLRNLGPIEAVRASAVVRLGAHPPAEEPGQPRGLLRGRASGGGSTGTSSRRTPRRCGAFPSTELSADWGAQRVKDLSLVPRRRSRR